MKDVSFLLFFILCLLCVDFVFMSHIQHTAFSSLKRRQNKLQQNKVMRCFVYKLNHIRSHTVESCNFQFQHKLVEHIKFGFVYEYHTAWANGLMQTSFFNRPKVIEMELQVNYQMNTIQIDKTTGTACIKMALRLILQMYECCQRQKVLN